MVHSHFKYRRSRDFMSPCRLLVVLTKTKKSSEEKAEPLEEKGEREVEEEAPATGTSVVTGCVD